MRAWLVVALVGCSAGKSRELDHDKIRVLPAITPRTDTVGEGKFAETSTFVLVDAENDAGEGAYITLSGELADAAGAEVGVLRAQSLWIPPGEQRTFALVDRERKPRPTAAAARIHVRGASVPASPPPAHVGELREVPDNGRIVAQGIVHNDADRAGNLVVIASFHDASGHPMTRPFSMVRVAAHATQAVQFVGPDGSVHGTIYIGDTVY
ncbi:MAG: hypothetical protein ACM31C_24115 [Acidobacteriota bacterium]